MKTRVTAGLLLAVVAGALLVVPASAAGRGTVVTKDDPAINALCETGVETLVQVSDAAIAKSRWILKQNGQPSRLHCRSKGATVDLGGSQVLQVRGAEAMALCPMGAQLSGQVGGVVGARFQMNARGNGFLRCVYAPIPS